MCILKKFVSLCVGVLWVMPLFGQTMTVEQMESKFRALYQTAYNALDSHDYSTAEEKLNAALELLVSNEATNSTYHIYALIKLGETYYMSGQTKKQESINKQILSIKNAIRPGSKRFIDYLYNLGIYYSNTGRFADAINSLNEALSYEESLTKMPGTEAKILHRQALCYYCNGDTEKAISIANKAVSSDDNKTPDYIKALAYYYYTQSDWKDLEDIIANCYDNSREPILRKFSQSKALDRAAYWSKSGLFFTDYLPSYAYSHPSNTLVSYAYDAALFSKGVLLAAENKSSELTLNSNDPELIKLYEHYLDLKGKKNRTLDEEFEMQSLSDVVLRYQKEHKNEYRKDFRIRWTDVQSKLNDGDIAIEFITVPDESGYDNYAALSIKKGMESPRLTKLANFKQLSSVPVSAIYTTSKLYDLIWGPLEQELEGVQNVFFAPAGMLYNTGIEYLPNEDDLNFCALRNVYRLSSTKEIVLKKATAHNKGALFGGINYDTKVSTLAKQSPHYDVNSSSDRNNSLDSLDLRGATTLGGFSFLEGTMEEVGDISMVLLESDIPADMYLGDDGSETMFKNLNGSDVNVLHIATHGFYYANKRIGRASTLDKVFRDLNLHFASDDIQTLDEDKMLTRSGLILAGANNVIKKIALPNGVEDGVLYADEIANVNLSKVDMLVMSACQSGLGDIAASEGVFGLQRGFKLAGVSSIIMSLWKVNDEATRILMTEMYKNLAKGQGKREALTNAQMYLRLIEDGRFDEPAYWAAFILLDALD